MRSLYLTLAAPILLIAASAGASQPAPRLGASAAVFTVFSHGAPVGSLQASVDESADGWTITSSGRLGSPMGIILRHAAIRYDTNWHPRELSIDATTHGEPTSVETSFANGTATERITAKGTPTSSTEAVAVDAILLPNPFFGAYEALSARLATAAPGSTLHIYAAPHVQYDARVGDSSAQTLQTADRLINARLTEITFLPTGQPPVQASLLIDPSGRLLRLSIPAQGLQVVREDIASVSTRRVTVSRPNDQSVNVPDNGFALAGTLSIPSASHGSAEKRPAIVLVAPASQTDRDGMAAGVPVMGELAGNLADAGFAVLRYDNRGTGQSGGRPDAATLEDYAEDARAAVKFMADRDGVDHDRVALLGYGDGGYIALLTASKEKDVKALVLVNAPSTTGAALTLERQERALAQSHLSEADKQQRIALQKQVQQAVLTGKGWDGVPAAIRQQSDTPLFRSFLAFDPAEVMKDVRQPILVVQGDRDEQVQPSDAQQLEQLANTRKKASVKVLSLAGANHELVAAGSAAAGDKTAGAHITPQVGSGIAEWLESVLPGHHSAHR